MGIEPLLQRAIDEEFRNAGTDDEALMEEQDQSAGGASHIAGTPFISRSVIGSSLNFRTISSPAFSPFCYALIVRDGEAGPKPISPVD